MLLFFYISYSLCAHFYIGRANSTYVLNNTGQWPVFVRLWATWCHHCRSFFPTWEELIDSEEFKNRVLFASIECNYTFICIDFESFTMKV